MRHGTSSLGQIDVVEGEKTESIQRRPEYPASTRASSVDLMDPEVIRVRYRSARSAVAALLIAPSLT